MKVTIAIGGVELTTSGLELDYRQVRALMRHAAGIALAMPRDSDAVVDLDRSPGTGLGFTAHLDLDADRGGYFGPPIYDDDEE